MTKHVFGLIAAAAASFWACGDDITEIHRVQYTMVHSLESVNPELSSVLPSCSKELQSQIYFQKKLYICNDKKWIELNGIQGKKGESGNNGTFCVTEAIREGQKIICSGDSVAVLKNAIAIFDTASTSSADNGKHGERGNSGDVGFDGIACVSEPTENGFDILCNGSIVGTITNGANANNGEDGHNGIGTKFVQGENGTYSQILGDDTLNIYSAVCGTQAYAPEGDYFCEGINLVKKCGGKNYSTSAEACCGDSVYTTTTHFCSSNTVYQKCGTATFTPTTHFCDHRDNHLYTYKVIGTQTWMTENLKFYNTTLMPNLSGQSWCYNNKAANCTSLGRLYSWTAAMNISSSYLTKTYSFSGSHQGACPNGWHVPRNTEWDALASYVDANNGSEGVGTSLKSSSGWTSDKIKGTNRFGFNGIGSGSYYPASTTFKYYGLVADFTSATQNSSADGRYILSLYSSASEWPSYATTLHKSSTPKRQAQLVRCIKN